MQTVKIFIVAPPSLREGLFSLFSNTRQIEIIGGSDCADDETAQAIIQLQPQVVIHSVNGGRNDSSLVETVKKKLLDVYYITFCEKSDLFYRIRYSALGVNHFLDQQSGLNQVLKILQPLISSKNGVN